MARRPYVPHKTQLEQFVEHGRQVSEKLRREYEEWGHLVAERRKEAGLSRKALAAMIGVSDSTIRNLERSRCKSVNPETLNRLRNVPALRLPASLSDGDLPPRLGYQAVWLGDYDPGALLEQARRQILSSEPRLLYEALNATKAASERYRHLYSTGPYGKHVENYRASISSVTKSIYELVQNHKIDIICLTSGHGWTEALLVRELVSLRDTLIDKIELVHPNVHIIKSGVVAFESMLPKDFCLRSMRLLLGDRLLYISTANVSQRTCLRRLFIMSQVVVNLDRFDCFACMLSSNMKSGDMLLFDVNVPFCESVIPRDIMAADSRLNKQLPEQFILAAENRIRLSLCETDPTVQDVEWSYDLKDSSGINSESLEAYSVHVNAVLHRASSGPQVVSAMRIHRHNPKYVARLLERYALSLVNCSYWRTNPGINYPGCYMLFIKK